MTNNTYGIIGLGKMGLNLALQATDKGYNIIGYDKYAPTVDQPNLVLASSLEDLIQKLPRPRKVFIYIPAGQAVDIVIGELTPLLEEGDIIIDGGNSYWGDSIRRAEKLKEQGLYLIDCGTSGGTSGAWSPRAWSTATSADGVCA